MDHGNSHVLDTFHFVLRPALVFDSWHRNSGTPYVEKPNLVMFR